MAYTVMLRATPSGAFCHEALHARSSGLVSTCKRLLIALGSDAFVLRYTSRAPRMRAPAAGHDLPSPSRAQNQG